MWLKRNKICPLNCRKGFVKKTVKPKKNICLECDKLLEKEIPVENIFFFFQNNRMKKKTKKNCIGDVLAPRMWKKIIMNSLSVGMNMICCTTIWIWGVFFFLRVMDYVIFFKTIRGLASRCKAMYQLFRLQNKTTFEIWSICYLRNIKLCLI